MFNSNASSASGDSANYIEDVFSTYAYNGNSTIHGIVNGIDLATKGGLVWVKSNTNATLGHGLHDSARGVPYRLMTNNTDAQSNSPQDIASFNTNGFTADYGPITNDSADTYISWTFRKQPKFFDVVTYTGNGSTNQSIAHSLGSVPGCIIVKCTSTGTTPWLVYHRGLAAPTNSAVRLDDNSALSAAAYFPTTPTSTNFFLGGAGYNVNNSGSTYVAYIFAHDAGGFGSTGVDNVISCDYGTAASGTSAINVTLGYEPQWILLKNATAGGDWYLFDTTRGIGAFNIAQGLATNSAAGDASLGDATYPISITSTGFSINVAYLSWAASSNRFIYIAIRRGDMKVPTDGTKVFDVAFEGNVPDNAKPLTRSTTGVVDMGIRNVLTGATGWAKWYSRLNDTESLTSTTSAAAVTAQPQQFQFSNGWGNATASSTITSQLDYMFKRAAGFFDVVCYQGVGSATTITHNLNAVPELMIVKRRDSGTQWAVYNSALGNTKYILLNSTAASATTSVYWNDTTPTSSVFSLGSSSNVNTTGGIYVAYLFATCAGVSKVGSYTGTGTTQQINCGFAAGSRFVMIKRTDSTGDWYVWDSARGIVAGNDPYLLINSTAAQVTNTDYVDTYAAGFELSSTAPAALNASGGTYIFLAIA